MSEFFAMGGYAFYVWSAYGLTAVVLVANLVGPVSRSRALRRRLHRQAALEALGKSH